MAERPAHAAAAADVVAAALATDRERGLSTVVIISVAVVAAAVYVPETLEGLSSVPPPPLAALVAVALSLGPFALMGGAKAARGRPRPTLGRVVRRGDSPGRNTTGVLARGPRA